MKLRWLQWSIHDLETGLGGLETHARSLARELGKFDVETAFSSDIEAVEKGQWDVIHTHGDSFPWPSFQLKIKKNKSKPLWVHTLHGLAYERMWNCREYFWLGGYRSAAKEVIAAFSSDVLLTIRSDLSLLEAVPYLKKKAALCGNGWDSWLPSTTKPETSHLQSKLKTLSPYWIFLGRGTDPTKNTAMLKEAIKDGSIRLIAAPGEGFEDAPAVIKIGKLTPTEVREALEMSQGLALPSLYDALPLVALEALSLGVPLVASTFGGLKSLPSDLQGFVRINSLTPKVISSSLKQASTFPMDTESRRQRAEHNRKLLRTWGDVASLSLKAVREKME